MNRVAQQTGRKVGLPFTVGLGYGTPYHTTEMTSTMRRRQPIPTDFSYRSHVESDDCVLPSVLRVGSGLALFVLLSGLLTSFTTGQTEGKGDTIYDVRTIFCFGNCSPDVPLWFFNLFYTLCTRPRVLRNPASHYNLCSLMITSEILLFMIVSSKFS